MQEIWKTYGKYTRYKFSNYGRVITPLMDSPKVWTRPDIRLRHYCGDTYNIASHVLFAKLFVVNPNNYRHVKLINKTMGFQADNLEWVKYEKTKKIVCQDYENLVNLIEYDIPHTVLAKMFNVSEKTIRNYRKKIKGMD